MRAGRVFIATLSEGQKERMLGQATKILGCGLLVMLLVFVLLWLLRSLVA